MADDRRPDRRRRNRIIVICAAALLAAAIAAIVYAATRPKMPPAESDQAESETEAETQSGQVTWKGKNYSYNENLSTYLFLGVDTEEQVETRQGQADAGQADALFLFVWDRKSDSITVISIPRDTMTEIETFDLEGNSLGTSRDHISLAYAYGDGKGESCRLVQEAVENLFYQLPIQGYCAMNLDGLSALAEVAGEVEVTVPNDSLKDTELSLQAGETVTLTKDNLETFLRYRDTKTDQSALLRLERQKAFLEACAQKAGANANSDPAYASELYGKMESYLTTNLRKDKILNLFTEASAEETTQWTVPGTGVQGTTYDEYEVDDDALYEKILETFYIEDSSEAKNK